MLRVENLVLLRYNISQYDFFDTYLAQYKLAFTAQPTGLAVQLQRGNCAELCGFLTWNCKEEP